MEEKDSEVKEKEATQEAIGAKGDETLNKATGADTDQREWKPVRQNVAERHRELPMKEKSVARRPEEHKPSNKRFPRKADPIRAESTKGPGRGKTPQKGMDSGDGHVVFDQLRQYVRGGAPAEYVTHTAVKLGRLAKDRRYQAYLKLMPTEEEQHRE
ncbi:LOW QUALITY PROTEIN: hypothetical protein PHMEG_00013053 [Phytophthora megakarya]|uniref:Uncharacterized protein n=1 Tax=Phytophthora megakarya TaxID=4795 RepID=A0A225W7N2_9STRA|nr:LOW QUALITY PROTEIN: hypothetical protein PHMEG_00013053 [Phytophthora megakarya]